MRTFIRRLIQALTAAVLITAGLLVPAGTASADVGFRIQLQAGHNVGIYTSPDASSPKITVDNYDDLSDSAGSVVYADCFDYGTPVGGGGQDWYLISGEYYGQYGTTHGWAGWVYGDYVDNSTSAGQLPNCTGSAQSFNVNGPNNIGLYSCYTSAWCNGQYGPKNSSNLYMNTGSQVWATCWANGENTYGPGPLWLHVFYQWNGYAQTNASAWVYAPALGVYSTNLPHCTIGDYTY